MRTFIHAKWKAKSAVFIAACLLFVLSYLFFSKTTDPLYAQALSTALSTATPSTLIYINFGAGILGDVIDSRYRNWSKAIGVGFEITTDLEPGSAGGGGSSGSASFEGLNIVKPISIDSPLLAIACTAGQHLQNVTIDFLGKPGASKSTQLLYRISMRDVTIHSVVSGSNSTEDSLKETLKLYAQRVEWIIYKYSATGAAAGEVKSCWDFAANRQCTP